ncbi:hypothetical protein ACFPOU_09415 [Massilia jejuensis]|uniref:Uncharacterized protein n=2 Tax=Massilia jejuensis TaxID=648894 RepID=A0ABW0PI91_9BURK
MNNLAWLGILAWGLAVTAFGLAWAPAPLPQAGHVAAHDAFFLVCGGLLTCLIGLAGLLGLMGSMPGIQGPGLRNEQKSRA